MTDLSADLRAAIRCHQAGRLQEAEGIYRRILRREPRHSDALHLLGTLAHQLGRNADALRLIQQAIGINPRNPNYLFNLGNIFMASGAWDEARTAYGSVIALRPDFADAHLNLASACRAQGCYEDARRHLEQALRLRPDFAPAYFNLGNVLKEQGRIEEAIAQYRAALRLAPDNSSAHHNLGLALQQTGDLAGAIDHYQKALHSDPRFAGAALSLGNALLAQGNTNAAAEQYRKAVQIRPEFAEAHRALGDAYRRSGVLDKAEACFREALRLDPTNATMHYELGDMLLTQGRPQEAIPSYQEAVRLDSGSAETYYRLGNAFAAISMMEDAVANYHKALQINPQLMPAHYNLGNIYSAQGQIEEAIRHYEIVVTLNPDHAKAFNNLGTALKEQGKLTAALECFQKANELMPDAAEVVANIGLGHREQGYLHEAEEYFRTALRLEPDNRQAYDCLLFTLNHDNAVGTAEVYEEHIRWGERYRKLADHRGHGNDRDPERRLRVGYVSPDFRNHPVAFFFEDLLSHHDERAVESYCYANVQHADEITARLEGLAGHWHRIVGLSDEAVARQVRDDGIDVLVDLAGHTGDNRLGVFALKPAPVQVSWLGYPNTTGLSAIDYRLTDGWADPEGSQRYYVEQLVRLPHAFFCYRPPHASPAVRPPPALRTGRITFGSFNKLAKINAEVIDLWARVLRAVPDSRLLLQARPLADAAVRARLAGQFAQAGVAPERLELAGSTPFAVYLERHHEVDIVLDTFPWNGHTNTCHALWMGVPVVTLSGQMHAMRMGRSVLGNIGLPELVAETAEEFVRIACALAADPARLAELRTSLRARMAASPLCDGARFARDVEAAYRAMWRRWCGCEIAAR